MNTLANPSRAMASIQNAPLLNPVPVSPMLTGRDPSNYGFMCMGNATQEAARCIPCTINDDPKFCAPTVDACTKVCSVFSRPGPDKQQQ